MGILHGLNGALLGDLWKLELPCLLCLSHGAFYLCVLGNKASSHRKHSRDTKTLVDSEGAYRTVRRRPESTGYPAISLAKVPSGRVYVSCC